MNQHPAKLACTASGNGLLVSIGGLITITHDGPLQFSVQGPADDDRFTIRGLKSREEAYVVGLEQAQRKADGLGEPVGIESYLGEALPYHWKVEPRSTK